MPARSTPRTSRPPGPPRPAADRRGAQLRARSARASSAGVADASTATSSTSGSAGSTCYFVRHPDYVREVLITQRASFTHQPRCAAKLECRWSAMGLLTSRGELHARQRRLMQPVFRKSRIEAYARQHGRTVAAHARPVAARRRRSTSADGDDEADDADRRAGAVRATTSSERFARRFAATSASLLEFFTRLIVAVPEPARSAAAAVDAARSTERGARAWTR